MNVKRAKRKSLGAFYTPENLSDLLCNWAIRDASDDILEPSFGGCGFLRSAATTFRRLGNQRPQNNIYGCDIDIHAFKHLSDTFGDVTDLSRFKLCDFIRLDPQSSWHVKFDAVVGNPPYLSYQKIDRPARDLAITRAKQLGSSLDLRSSLWAYFVVLSSGYLKEGGRSAWVLPGSFIFADYSKEVRAFVASRFMRTRAFLVQERLFISEGTEEQTVVLLADGFCRATEINPAADVSLVRCRDVSQLDLAIETWASEPDGQPTETCQNATISQLGTAAKEIIAALESTGQRRQLKEAFDIRIGLVTGDNKYFVIPKSEATRHQINPEWLTPVVSKCNQLPGLIFDKLAHKDGLNKNLRVLLVSADLASELPPPLRNYLECYDEERIKSTSTFKKRKIWSMPDDGRPPFAFLPVMHHGGPRLVLNRAGINCTNTIHRAYLRHDISVNPQLCAISMLTSYSQISAEIVGRRYGAGVLKHEPREADEIAVLLPSLPDDQVGDLLKQIDWEWKRSASHQRLREMADRAIYHPILGADWMTAHRALSDELLMLRASRSPKLADLI